MSRTIDNRVVQMTFENQQFEKGAQESLSTLEKLKASLSHLGDGKAFNLSKIDTSGMTVLGESVDNVGGRFSILEEIATGALRRIGEMAVDAGMEIANAMMFDAVSSGWDKYARETEAVQTLMAATRNDVGAGKKWADEAEQMAAVEEQLDKLMWFTDETSYKYVEMVSNIAKFTSNGFGLEDAVTSMIGIAGAASISGVSTERAAAAMDVFSKSAATGYMQLKDWRQLENMNFTTNEFKNLLVQTGLELGKIEEIFTDAKGIKHYDSLVQSILTKNNKDGFTVNSIANSMTKGRWIDDEVIEAVTKKYGEFSETLYEVMSASDNWDNTVELLSDIDSIQAGQKAWSDFFTAEQLGAEGFTEKLEFLIDTQNELGKTAFMKGQEAKTFQEAWEYATDAASSAWKTVFKNLFGNYTEAKELFTNLSDIFWDLFVAPSSAIADVTTEWYKLGGRTELLDGIANLWEYAGHITDAIGAGFRTFFPAKSIEEAGDSLFELTLRFKKWTEGLDENGLLIKTITGLSKGFFGVLKGVFTVIGGGIKFVVGLTTSFIELVRNSEATNRFFTAIKNTFTKLSVAISRSGEKIKVFKDAFKETEAYKKLSDALGKIWDVLSKFAGNLLDKATDKVRDFGNWIVTLDFEKVATTVAKFTEPMIDWLGKGAEQLLKFRDAVQEMVKNAGLDDFGQKTSKAFSELLEAGPSVDGFIKILVALKEDVQEALKEIWNAVQNGDYSPSKIVEALKKKFEEGLESLGSIGQKIKSALFGEDNMVEDKNSTFFSLSSTFKQAEEDTDKFVINFNTIMSGLLTGAGVVSLVAMTRAIWALGQGLAGLGKIPGRVATLLKDIHGAINAFTLNLRADSLQKVAIAIGILAVSLVALSYVPMAQLGKAAGFMIILALGITAICSALRKVIDTKAEEGATTYEIVLANVQKSAKRMANLAGIGVLAAGIGLGIWLIVSAIVKAANLIERSPAMAVFGSGLIVTIGICIGKFIERISYSVGSIDTSIVKTILGLAAALAILVIPVSVFGKMNPGALIQGGIAVGVLLAAISKFAGAMDQKKLSGISKGLLALSAAILIISFAFKNFESVSWTTIAAGTIAIVALLGALTLFAQFLKDTSTLIGLAALSAAMIAIAYAATLLAPALTELAGVPWDALLKLGVIAGALTLLGAIAGGSGGVIALGIIAVAGAMTLLGYGAKLGGEGVLLFGEGVKLLSESILPLATNFVAACTAISDGASQIGEAAYNLITSIALGIGRAAPVVAQTVTTLMASVLLGILQGLVKITEMIIPAITECINRLTLSLYQNFPTLMDAITDFINGLGYMIVYALTSMIQMIPGVDFLFGDKIDSFKAGIQERWGASLEGLKIGTDLTDGVAEGLHGGSSGVWGAAEEVSTTTVEKLGSKKEDAKAAGGGFMDMFGGGMLDKLGSITDITSMVGENGAMNLAGFGDMFSGAGELDVSSFISGFGGGEADFTAMLDQMGVSGVAEISSFAPEFEAAAETDIGGVTQAITSEAPETKQEVHDLANMSVEELLAMAKQFTMAGDKDAAAYVVSLAAKKRDSERASNELASAAVNEANNRASDFRTAGEQSGSGYSGGIRSSIASAVSAAGDLARSALGTIKNVLGIASPSKEMTYLGEFGGEGFAIGLVNMIGAVRSSAQRVADESLIAMQETMNNLSTGLDESLDMQPVIRPVLDLSDVQNGSAYINNMLGGHGLYASANGLGSYSAYDKEARLASMLNQQSDGTPIPPMNFTIYGAEGQDPKEIAYAVRDILNHELERGKAGALA